MRRFAIGIFVAAVAASGCAEAIGDEERDGARVVTGEQIPQEWLDDPTTPIGNVTIYVDGEPAERLTLYSGDMGAEMDTSEACANRQMAVCGNRQIYECNESGWSDLEGSTHVGNLPHVCRNIMDMKRWPEIFDCSDDSISLRYEGFADDLESEVSPREPYSQPGESELTDYTGGSGDYTNPGSEGSTGGASQPSGTSNDPADELDTTSDSTQPSSSGGSSSGGSGSSGSSGSSGGSSGDRSGGSSTTQPARY